jgi:two-component system response regulator FixJ
MCDSNKPLVCVVDDEAAVRHLTQQILESKGMAVRCYASAHEFLAEFDESATSCVVTDLRMPQIDGLQLQQRLNSLGSVVAVVVLSGLADVRTAVRLMEDGILALLEKPFQPAELLAAVERSVDVTRSRRKRRDDFLAAKRQLERLTDEERSVSECVIAGLPNKAIAAKLGLSLRTVDRRRQAVLTKMSVHSVTELATLVAQLKVQNT